MESTRGAILVVFLLVACSSSNAKVEEENPEFWRTQARKTLQEALDRKLNTNVAKNILFFLGDGMGITTFTAARILKGQLQNQTGEETVMTMDTFPNVGLVKTYSVDFQIPDSAATGTAYLCGVKTNLNTIGVSAAARNGACKTQKGREVTSILKWAKDAGKSVGIVTTTRVQHATPAASYAHSASRKWYSDADMPDAAKRDGCTDISSQLLKNTDIDVIIGGGRKYMTPRGTKDPEYPRDFSSRGKRKDGHNLINEWKKMKMGKVAHYVWNKTDFDAVDPEKTDYLMALFEPGDLRFEVERDPSMDPSIVETTEKAIRILQKNPNGFFLLVEGEDKTTHNQFSNGFPFRGQSILGKSPLWATDIQPYTILMYGNGPGHKLINGSRPDIRNVNTKTKDYVQLAAVPTESATHSGEDVAVLARGPMAHIFQGVNEQNYVAHAMAYAACVGTDQRHCQGLNVVEATTPGENMAVQVHSSVVLVTSLLTCLVVQVVLM
ncbi:alkaline phosphatase, tissue-nonspecific isozyme [Solea solea]|uniref:alkaline phosphatase, tissue-nonspecific isozyme n=1 Tax=Solea solea TaxID=90069 RepID=UPI00272A7137|nr:alkaline phosphatase, tissue-nonspecific isozyme [Solea solea]